MSEGIWDPKQLAAACALGALDAPEREAFEATLAADTSLSAEVASYREAVAYIAFGAPRVEPPARLRHEVLRRAGGVPEAAPVDAERSAPGSAYEQLDWEPGGVAGLSLHWIRPDTAEGQSVVLMRGEPGTRYPDHLHTGEEHGFILRGEFRDAAGQHREGDYVHYPAGSEHRDIVVTGSGICIFLVVSGPVVRLQG